MTEAATQSEPRMPDTMSGRRTLLALAVVGGLAFAFGWPTRHGEFLMGDDQRFVTNHVLVNHPSLRHAWKLLTTVHGDLWQPLPMLSFQANFALAAPEPASRFGVSPYGFHLTNIVLHMINAILVCLIALRISRRLSVAFLTGAMFACHPYALEPVAWVSGRMILLASFFALITILICLYRREDGGGSWPWWAGLTWLLSLLSKVLPGVPIATVWCDYGRHRRVPRRAWVTYAVLLALGITAGAYALDITRRTGFTRGMEKSDTTSIPVRCLLAGRYYLENYVWPSGVAPWSPPPSNVMFGSRATVVAIIELGALLILTLMAWRYSRMAFIGLVLFAILAAPFLATGIARRLLAADRYMYLPLLGLNLAFAAILVQMSDWLARRSSYASSRALMLAPIVMMGTWLWISWNLAPVWSDTLHFSRRIVEVYPDEVTAHNELARAYLFEKQPDRALQVVADARKRWPANPRLAAQAGEAYRMKKDWRRAEEELRKAATQMPGHLRTQYHYALTIEKLGRRAEARKRYLQILEEHDGHLQAMTALARSYVSTGEIDQAVVTYEKVLRINAFHRSGLFELALLQIRRQSWPNAERLLREILKLNPNDQAAEFHLAVVLFRQGHKRSALGIYDRLLEKDESNVNIHLNRAYALADMDRIDQAEEAFHKILSIQPDHLDAAIGLHELFQAQRRFTDLLGLWSDFERITNRTEAKAYLAWSYVLNDQMAQAERMVASIPLDTPDRNFAEWALIYDALRRGALSEPETYFHQTNIPTKANPNRQRQTRRMMSIFTELPEKVRSSAAGQYTLARLFLYYGDQAKASMTAQALADNVMQDQWTKAARDLLEVLAASKPVNP
ncbi:MAG: tetratricopeptide repeat protein [Phycisphaerales bacterium]|nr:tetratricopeptide repeat protein [Phycisphaerales bacterium]